LAVVVVAALVASRINLDYYALQPGSAQSVQQFITVPPAKGHPVTHPVLLTDVQIGRVNALSYLYFKLRSDTVLDKVSEITGGTPPSELGAQGVLEMSQAEQSAKAAAFTRLGYQVPATPSGAVIAGTFPGTPAYSVLSVGDVVTAVDGAATPTAAALDHTLAGYHSGQTVTLTVRRGGTSAPAPVPVTLKTTVVNLGYNTGGKGPYVSVDLGIQPEDQVDYTFPFPVKIDVANIGGPSAGLAMTLGVIDALTSGSLTGGRTVAATGTIDAQGDVGDVGGVAQKTVAVENAGASIFLVPPQEYKAAMSKDRPGLKVYAVSTLDQALGVLAHNGGTVPPAVTQEAVPAAAAG
jgi:PDZ domain-containing protein